MPAARLVMPAVRAAAIPVVLVAATAVAADMLAALAAAADMLAALVAAAATLAALAAAADMAAALVAAADMAAAADIGKQFRLSSKRLVCFGRRAFFLERIAEIGDNLHLSCLEQNQASCPQFWQVLNHAEAFSVEICGSAFLMAW
jgi:hypothetical protein